MIGPALVGGRDAGQCQGLELEVLELELGLEIQIDARCCTQSRRHDGREKATLD